MNPKSFSRRRTPAGFTLLEILIVVALIALIMGVLVSNLWQGNLSAQIQVVRTAVNSSMQVPLEAYRVAMGSYPTTEEGLPALVNAPANNTGNWAGPYMKDATQLKDPWGQPYRYAYPGTRNKTRYDIWSAGPDQKDGTADDIGNW